MSGSGLSPACSPNSVILSIHNGLPYLFNAHASGYNASLDQVINDILRAGGWAGLIIFFSILLMVANCVCCCFVCGLCCGRDRKPPAIKIGIGVVTFVLVVVSIILVLAEFGVEVAIDNNIVDSAQNVADLAGNFSTNSSADSDTIKLIVRAIENPRHTGVLSCLGILLFKLLIPLVWLTLGPFCGTPVGPLLIFIDLVVTGVITLVLSVGMALVFAVLVIYSDVCVQLYDLVPDVCTDPTLSLWNGALDGFCNKTMTYGFTLFITGMILVLLLLLIMLFGAIFASSLTGKRTVEISVSADEVWTTDAPIRINANSEDEAPLMGPVADFGDD